MLKNALLYSATLWLVIFVASQAVAAPIPAEETTTASPNTTNRAPSAEVNAATTETTTPVPLTTTTNSTESSTSPLQVTSEAANSPLTQGTASATEDAQAKTPQNPASGTEDAQEKTSQDATSTSELAPTTTSQSPPSVTEATTTTMSQSPPSVTEATTTTMPQITVSTTTEASTTTVTQTTALTTVGQTSKPKVLMSRPPLKLENMKPRDVNQTEANVNDTKATCSSALQDALSGSGKIYPEKFVFNVSDSTASDAQDYCAQLNETVQQLRDACAADTEAAASAKVASLSAMVATLCPQNSTELKVMADKDSSCMEDIKNVTMSCSSFDKDYSYPTEMLIHEMEPNTCKNLTEAKSCIASNLAKRTGCSADHQQAVVHLMNSLLGGCSTGDSATTAAAAVDSTTMTPKTTANANTTAAPSVAPTHPSASPSRNAAEGLRLHSIVLLLFVALATAIPVRWM